MSKALRYRFLDKWQRIRGVLSRFFSENLLHQLTFSAAACFVAFHLFGFTQVMLFNEDLWLRGLFNPHTILTKATATYWSPLYYSFLAFSDAFPVVGPWAHGAAMLLFGLLILVTVAFLRYSLQLAAWPSALTIAILACLPAITESTYWVAATHSEVGVILYVVFLMLLPKNKDAATPSNLLLAGVALVSALSASPLNYLAAFLALGILAFFAGRDAKKWASVFFTLMLFAAYFAWRNYLLNGDFLQFSTGYNQGEPVSWQRLQEKLSLIVSATNPLASALLSVKDKVFFEPTLSKLIQLAWFVPMVAFVLLRRPDARIAGLALYGLGAVATQLLVNVIVMRYQLPVIFCTAVMIALCIDILKRDGHRQLPLWLGTCMLAATFLSFSTKAVLDTSAWWRYGVAETGVIELARKHNDPSTQIVADMDQVVSWIPRRSILTGGINATFGGIRRVMLDLNLRSCAYGGTQLEQTSPGYVDTLAAFNSEMALLGYGVWGEAVRNCPIIPSPSRKTYCYTFETSPGLVGAYRRLRGGEIIVPWCTGGIPLEHRGNNRDAAEQYCSQTVVRCFDGD
jgi:hypothetical protein